MWSVSPASPNGISGSFSAMRSMGSLISPRHRSSAVSILGIVMTAISFLMLIVVIVRRLMFGDPVAGWASTICVIIFIGGLQMFCLGVIAQYIAKMYLEVKRRPHFIIAETNQDEVVKLR